MTRPPDELAAAAGTALDPTRRVPAAAELALWFACTFICVHVLRNMGFDATWCPIHDAMHFTIIPPFRHRLLFALLARGVQMLRPGFHDPRCYFVSQSVAAAIAFGAIRPWAARFMTPGHAALSRPLLLMMLVPTFTYWDFYDIGIVASYTLALWALLERRWLLYLLVFAAATLNHENSVLMVPLALLFRYRSWRIGVGGLAWAALQVGGYLALRALLFRLLPVDVAWQSGKLAFNLDLIVHHPGEIARTVLLLGAWVTIVTAGWSRLPREIRWALLVLGPEIVVVTLLFGQINELRMFDLLLPVLVVAMLAVFGARPAPGSTTARASQSG